MGSQSKLCCEEIATNLGQTSTFLPLSLPFPLECDEKTGRGRMQKRLYDIGWSDETKSRGWKQGIGHGKALEERSENLILEILVTWERRRRRKSGDVRSWESENKRAGESMTEASGSTSPLMALCWECQEGGVRVGRQLCSLIMTRSWGQCMGCAELSDAELEVRLRAALAAFLCLFRKIIGPTTAHLDNNEVIDGLWRGE